MLAALWSKYAATNAGLLYTAKGTAAWIDRTAKVLGFAVSDYITASYGRLYMEWCKKNKRKPGDMVFN